MKDGFHQPVLGKEAVEYLITQRDGIYVDCTVGGGGHSYQFLSHASRDALLIGLDADAEALTHARKILGDFTNIHLRQTYYDQLEIVLYEVDKYPVDGIFYDLGISSFQVDVERRGFSFQQEGPLDMRFDQRQEVTAAHILNTYPREELEEVIRRYGEERHWRAIAREIVRRRAGEELANTRQLVDIVRSVVGERFLNKSLARVFQSIRIEVNRELERLQASLEAAHKMLREGGRLVVISYHSLEDRLVKTFFREKHRSCICPPELPQCICDKVSELNIMTSKPVVAGAREVRQNPRARSAKLRAAQKIVDFTEEVV